MSFRRDTCWPRRLSNRFWLMSFYCRLASILILLSRKVTDRRTSTTAFIPPSELVCFVIAATTFKLTFRLTFKFDRNYHVRQKPAGVSEIQGDPTIRKPWHELRARTLGNESVRYIGISMPQGQRRAARKSPGSIGRVSFPGWSFAFVIGYELPRFVQLSVDSPGIDFSEIGIRRRYYSEEQAGEKLITIMRATRIFKEKNTKHGKIDSRRFESWIIKSYSRLHRSPWFQYWLPRGYVIIRD